MLYDRIRRAAPTLFLALTLTACASAAPAPAPTSAPIIAPTVAPTGQATAAPTVAPTIIPTAAPTAAPAPAGLLPAPLYVLDEGQVVRISADGATKTTLTDEKPFAEDALAITELDVSPANGQLAYVVQGTEGNTLVVTDADGQSRRVLIEGAPLSAPRWSPDGSAVAVQMWHPLESGSPWKGGVWTVSAFSGEARQLLANDPQPQDGVSEAWGYAPESWSPDGSKLLVSRYSLVSEACNTAMLDVGTGALVIPEAPEGAASSLRVACRGGSWAADSSGVYVSLRGPGLSPAEPGLYLADAASGAMSLALPTTTAEGKYALVQAQFSAPDGSLYVLLAAADAIPDPAADPGAVPPSAALYRVQPGGAPEQIGQESFILYGTPAWAPQGAGLVVPSMTSDGGVEYFYASVDGQALRLPLGPTVGMAWGVR